MKRLLLAVLALPLLMGQSECNQPDVPGMIETFTLPGDVELTMLPIENGIFMMGTLTDPHSGTPEESPLHSVAISNAFHLGETEVTKAQWEAVMNTTPWSGQDFVLDDPDSPAVYVSWDDAKAFIAALNILTGETFRLPTEAEWEYACRAGSTTSYYFSDSADALSDYAWWHGNSVIPEEAYAHVVAQKLANDFGLFDMHGNVTEWCEDWYSATYYSVSPDTDPPGPTTGEDHLLRGGSYNLNATFCRSAFRNFRRPTSIASRFGFRVAK